MLARRVDALPAGDEWIFEPKWDGFRTLVFRDRDALLLQSRDGKQSGRLAGARFWKKPSPSIPST